MCTWPWHVDVHFDARLEAVLYQISSIHVRRSVSCQVLHSLVVSPVVVLSSRLDYCTTTLAGLLSPQRATVGDKCCCTTCMLSTETRAHHIASYGRLSESSLSSLNSLTVACAMRNTWAALCGIRRLATARYVLRAHVNVSAWRSTDSLR